MPNYFLTCLCGAALLLGSGWLAPANASANDAVTVQHRIIGGEPVFGDNANPWIVALAYNSSSDLVQRQFCGGSLIADRWVMTAAHCLYDRNGSVQQLDSFKVAINAANLRDEDATELLVTNIIIHPEYDHNAPNPHSDIALLELSSDSGIEPIAVSTKPTDSLIGLNATIMGWGAVEFDIEDPEATKYPVLLHGVDVPIVSLEVCNQPISYAGALVENQLCAGVPQGGRDSCVGDSGGPMTVIVDGKKQQAGIVSFGYGCALPNFYGVYTDVPYFIAWINQYVYVGEPEFEPEQLSARATTTASSSTALSGIGISGNSDTASVSWLVAILFGFGLRRRRLS